MNGAREEVLVPIIEALGVGCDLSKEEVNELFLVLVSFEELTASSEEVEQHEDVRSARRYRHDDE